MGASPSAVSKAINHCPGLGTDLRERILDVADSEGIQGRRSPCDVYVILPDTPTYFWRTFLSVLGAALRAQKLMIKYNVYTALGDGAAVSRYLDEAELLAPSVLIIASRYDGIADRLAAMATRCAVLSAIELANIPNVFFVGSDHRADGRLLGEQVRAENPAARRILVLIPDGDDRFSGFAEATTDIDTLTWSITGSENASELARLFDSIHRATPIDAVVCMDGNTSMVCMALKKCRLSIPCYGFEAQPIDPRYPLPVGEVVQDLASIAENLTDYATRFIRTGTLPPQKNTFIASSYEKRRREG